jgi:hypothetical protein
MVRGHRKQFGQESVESPRPRPSQLFADPGAAGNRFLRKFQQRGRGAGLTRYTLRCCAGSPMSIEQQDNWLFFAIQCYFFLLQLSGLVFMSYGAYRARRYMRNRTFEVTHV